MTTKNMIFLLELLLQAVTSRVSCVEYLEQAQVLYSGQKMQMLKDFYRELKRGVPISEALKIFDFEEKEYIVGLLAAAEKNGTLEHSLQALIEDLHCSRFHLQQLKNAVSYPLFLVLFFTGFISVYPFFLRNFMGLREVAKNARGVDGFYQFYFMIVDFRFQIASVGVIIFLACFFLMMTVKRTVFIHSLRPLNIWKQLPFFRDILYYEALRDIYSRCSLLFHYHIPALEAVKQMQLASGKHLLALEISDMADALQSGMPLAKAMEPFATFDASHIWLIQNTESNDQLVDVMKQIAQYYQNQFRLKVNQILVWLEPLLIILIGFIIILFVLFVAFQVTNTGY